MDVEKNTSESQYADSERTKNLLLLQALQEELGDRILLWSEKYTSIEALRRIPLLKKYLRNFGESGEEIARVGGRLNRLVDTVHVEDIANGFQFGSVALALFDFVRIPFVYLFAYIAGEKIPISLNSRARWAFAAIVLILTVVSIAVPVTAPIIAFIAAAGALGGALVETAKALYDRSVLRAELRQLKKVIDREQLNIAAMNQTAKELEAELLQAKEEAHLEEIYQRIAAFQDEFNSKIDEIAALKQLKTRQAHLEEQIKQLEPLRLLDKSIKIVWGALTVIGLVVAVFFPPVGLAILLGTATVSATYFFVRLTTPLWQPLIDRIAKRFSKDREDTPAPDEAAQECDLNEQTEENTTTLPAEEESTHKVLKELFGDEQEQMILQQRFEQLHKEKSSTSEKASEELGSSNTVLENPLEEEVQNDANTPH